MSGKSILVLTGRLVAKGRRPATTASNTGLPLEIWVSRASPLYSMLILLR